jgi:hypothetical protein
MHHDARGAARDTEPAIQRDLKALGRELEGERTVAGLSQSEAARRARIGGVGSV